MVNQVIVVGGGLAGLSAAHTVLERGGRVLMVDKNQFMGGNSTKATSGINGAGTQTQRKNKIQDAPEVFLEDTIRGGAKSEPHAKVLTYESGPGVEWLIERFGLDLSLVSRLGGHSQQRTHRGGQKFPGMTITYQLMEQLEDIAEKDPNKQRIQLKTKLVGIETDPNTKEVIGAKLVNMKDNKEYVEKGFVVLATGGYGADQTSDSILKKYRPELTGMPTTCGDHCTGDGIKLGMRDCGAGQVDLNSVQVHPTGLVNPNEPDQHTLFLQQEALRGCGGILLDCEGNRFQNELGRRDYVSGRMFDEKKSPYRLCLNSKASKEIAWHCKHYKSRKLMKQFNNMEELSKEMATVGTLKGNSGKILENIKETFAHHNEIDKKQTDNPDGGPFDQYGGGKSWDKWGKKFYRNGPLETSDQFHVQIVTPVVHYTMGGILAWYFGTPPSLF